MSIFSEEKDVPEEFRLKNPVIQKEYLINGDLRLWNGKMQEVLSPVCVHSSSGLLQKTVGQYPLLTEKESLEALNSSVNAYKNGRGLWPAMSVHDRIYHIEGFLAHMQEKKREIVHLLMWEIGKSYQDSEREFNRTIDLVRNTINAAKTFEQMSSEIVEERGIVGHTRFSPLGVVLCMGPFNYPLFETFTTIIPALIMGNTVIIKPPKHGVLLHYPLLSAFQNYFPQGVVNTIYGESGDILHPLLSTGKIDCLAFIGSGKVADVLKSSHPKPNRLKSVFGLEAKNPAIILPDADMDMAVRECIRGCLAFNGQRCTALKILFVHSGIAEKFLRRCAEEIGNLRFGMPWEQDVMITPLPEPDKTFYLKGLLENAIDKGAIIMNEFGGSVNKTFFYPALLFPVSAEMRLYNEEQFGPLIPVVPFDDIETPIEYIVRSNYGQQVSIFGNDPETIANLTDVLVNQVCRVNINSKCQRGPDILPFSGRKDSGEGTLSVSDALRLFSVRTVVAIKKTDKNVEIITKLVKERRPDFLSAEIIS